MSKTTEDRYLTETFLNKRKYKQEEIREKRRVADSEQRGGECILSLSYLPFLCWAWINSWLAKCYKTDRQTDRQEGSRGIRLPAGSRVPHREVRQAQGPATSLWPQVQACSWCSGWAASGEALHTSTHLHHHQIIHGLEQTVSQENLIINTYYLLSINRSL